MKKMTLSCLVLLVCACPGPSLTEQEPTAPLPSVAQDAGSPPFDSAAYCGDLAVIEKEPNDSYEEPTVLTAELLTGNSQAGSAPGCLPSNPGHDDVDYYRIDVGGSAPGNLVLSLEWLDGPGTVSLEGTNRDDNTTVSRQTVRVSKTSPTANFYLAVSPGNRYLFRVSSQTKSGTPAPHRYRIGYSANVPHRADVNEVEPNNTRETASALALNQDTVAFQDCTYEEAGSTHCQVDEDWWTLSLKAGPVSFTWKDAPHTEFVVPIVAVLRDAAGRTFGSFSYSDFYPSPRNEPVTVEVPASGKYYVWVFVKPSPLDLFMGEWPNPLNSKPYVFRITQP